MSNGTQQTENASRMHQDARSGASVKCKGCPVLFVPNREWQQFHSRACRARFHKEPHAKQPSSAERLAALEQRVAELEEAVALVRGHLVL